MSQLRFNSPGFPIYKANIVPFIEDGVRVHCREMTEHVVEDWRGTLLSMREFIGRALSHARSAIERLSGEERRYRVYELVGDAITAYLRMPLLRDPLMGLSPSPFTFYLDMRLYYPDTRSIFEHDPVSFISNLDEGRMATIHREIRGFMGRELEYLWFSIPADTRPLYNTSGLIPHLLTTSALSWSLALSGGMTRGEASKLRLAALFHDISKPFDFPKHHELAPEVLEMVLKEIIDDEALHEITMYVARHHAKAETPQSQVLKKADSLASGSDRLAQLREDLVINPLRGALQGTGLDPSVGYESGGNAWEFWRRLEELKPGYMRRLSEELAEALLSPGGPDILGKLREKDGVDATLGDLRLCIIDIGAIQEFITRTRDLRSVASSSLVVDSATVAHLPLLIQSTMDREGYWVPLEAFLVTSGGSLTLLLPGLVAEKLKDVWASGIARYYEKIGLRIYLADTEFTGNYYRDSGHLARAAHLEKLTHESQRPNILVMGIEEDAPRLCELCYSSPAEDRDGRCSLCRSLHEIGGTIHFGRKWSRGLQVGEREVIPENHFNLEYTQVKDIMYIIAGHEKPWIEPRERKRNIAAIKLDGNLMGVFFAESTSLSDALERSARVDMALKKALERAVHELYEGVRRSGDEVEDDHERAAGKAASACFLGLMYAGGDDALMLCPSWCAIPLACRASWYFCEEMGRVRALSAGVAAAPPEHDVWALIDATNKLLDLAKDKVGRRSSAVGGLTFDFVEGGLLSESSVEERLFTASNEGVTVQPLAMSECRYAPSITSLLSILGVPTEGEELFALAFSTSRSGENKMKEQLKTLREEVVKSVGVSRTAMGGAERSGVLVLYLNRMLSAARSEHPSPEKEMRARSYEALVKLVKWSIVNPDNKPPWRFPLVEVSTLVKFLGGGMI